MLDDHRFTVDCVQPKCTELRRLVQKLEVMLGEKRRILHKFLDLIDGIEAANKWSTSALSHLSRQEDPRSSLTDEDVSYIYFRVHFKFRIENFFFQITVRSSYNEVICPLFTF